MKLAAVSLSAALLAAGVPSARAADEGDAVALVARGAKLLAERDYLGALNRFREAYDLAPTPAIAARIGLAEHGLGRWAEAEVHLEEAGRGPPDAWLGQNRTLVDRALGDVRARLGWLTATGSPRGAIVRVDNEVRGVLPFPRPIRVETGERAVRIEAPGHRPWGAMVVVRAGATAPLRIALEPAPATGPSPLATTPIAALATQTPPPPAATGRQRLLGWIFVAGGVAAAGAGLALVATNQSDQSAAWLAGGALLCGGGGLAIVGGVLLLDAYGVSVGGRF